MTDSAKLAPGLTDRPIDQLTDQINQLLPQTQCTKCGYAGCKPYAEAIANGTASYNQCPPGGQEGIERLAALLHKPVIALNPENGVERPRTVALIDETLCIGCTLCIQACPVDAIAGAPKQMHTVVTALCTGCDLCVPPCPVDCITMVPVTGAATGWQAWSQPQADAARSRHERHLNRHKRALTSTKTKAPATPAENSQAPLPPPTLPTSAEATHDASSKRQALVQAALARARQRQQAIEVQNRIRAKEKSEESMHSSDALP